MNRSFSPHGRIVPSRVRQLAHLAAIGQHAVDLLRAAARRHKYQVTPIGRPAGVLVAALAVSQLVELAFGYVHEKDIEIPGRISPRPRKRNYLAVGVPGRIRSLTLPVRESLHAGPVEIHPENLLGTGPAGNENNIAPGLWIHLG